MRLSMISVVAVSIGFLTMIMAVKIIPAGHVGVIFNTISGVEKRTLNPGLHFTMPFIQSIDTLDCRTHNLTLKKEEAVSVDQQQISSDVCINYSPYSSEVGKLYQDTGFDYESKIVVPVVREALKAQIAKYKVDEILDKREAISQAIRDDVKQRLNERGLRMELVSLMNLSFSDEYRQAVERKQVALQEAEAAKNRLLQSKIDADIVRAKAQGEADRIETINKAMSVNPSYLQLEAIQKLNPNAQVIYVPTGSTQLLIPQLGNR